MDFLTEENRFYKEDENGHLLAEITFVKTGDTAYIIDHTFVDPSLRGQGIAEQLVQKVMAKAKAEKRLIIPLCPYAKGYFEKHPEYRDYVK